MEEEEEEEEEVDALYLSFMHDTMTIFICILALIHDSYFTCSYNSFSFGCVVSCYVKDGFGVTNNINVLCVIHLIVTHYSQLS